MAKYDLEDSDGNLEKLAAQLEHIQDTDVELVDESEPPQAPARQKAARNTQQMMPLIFAGVVGLILLVALALFLWQRNRNDTTTTMVPNIVGQPIQAARKATDDAKLKIVLKYDSASTQPTGTVTETDPAAGTRMPVGSKISITVAGAHPIGTPASTTIAPVVTTNNSGNTAATTSTTNVKPAMGMVKIPNVENKTEDAARQQLGELGLRVIVKKGAVKDSPDNVVLYTKPAAGIDVKPGSDVEILVNSLSGATSTPTTPVTTVQKKQLADTYVGQSSAAVESELKKLGYTTELRVVDTKAQLSGKVVSISPPAGSMVAPGEKITITVAK